MLGDLLAYFGYKLCEGRTGGSQAVLVGCLLHRGPDPPSISVLLEYYSINSSVKVESLGSCYFSQLATETV